MNKITVTQGNWKASQMFTHWFCLTEVLFMNTNGEKLVISLGCQMQGYKYANSNVPCVVSASHPCDDDLEICERVYDKPIGERAEGILNEFLKHFDLDEIYSHVQKIDKDHEISIKWFYDDNWE